MSISRPRLRHDSRQTPTLLLESVHTYAHARHVPSCRQAAVIRVHPFPRERGGRALPAHAARNRCEIIRDPSFRGIRSFTLRARKEGKQQVAWSLNTTPSVPVLCQSLHVLRVAKAALHYTIPINDPTPVSLCVPLPSPTTATHTFDVWAAKI